MKYRISRRADADIERICDFIAKDNPEAAETLDERIHHTIQLLARFPGMGHTRADVKDKRYLFWALGKYVIAYRVEAKELVVVRVLHGARDFRKLFGGRPA
jgi:plasmid stabilization system protein ParE